MQSKSIHHATAKPNAKDTDAQANKEYDLKTNNFIVYQTQADANNERSKSTLTETLALK